MKKSAQVSAVEVEPKSNVKPGQPVCPHCGGTNIFTSKAGRKCMNTECPSPFLGGQVHGGTNIPTRSLNPGSLSSVMTARGDAHATSTIGRIA